MGSIVGSLCVVGFEVWEVSRAGGEGEGVDWSTPLPDCEVVYPPQANSTIQPGGSTSVYKVS